MFILTLYIIISVIKLNISSANMDEDAADIAPRNVAHHGQSALSLFPSTLLSAAIPLIGLLDDAAVSEDGNAVYEMAYQVKPTMNRIIFLAEEGD